MNELEVTRTVEEELERIPEDEMGSPQSVLRGLYHLLRREGLARDPNQIRAAASAESVATLRKVYFTFEPELSDPDYFGWTE